MSEKIDLTWPDGDVHPMRIVSTEVVSYPIECQVKKNGKKVIERTRLEYSVASARPATEAEVRAQLRGKNLACWCALDAPCHADVLLEIANNP